MKNLLLILFIIPLIGFSQRYSHNYNSSGYGNEPSDGLLLTIGGTSLTIAGFLIPPDYIYIDKTSAKHNNQIKKPIIKTPERLIPITFGITFIIVGGFMLLGEN